MQAFVSRHPFWTQFAVLVAVVVAGAPAWGLLWWGIAETGRIVIAEGCQARGYSCEYQSQGMVILLMIFLPFFFAAFVWFVAKVSGHITNKLFAWAGLDPRRALL